MPIDCSASIESRFRRSNCSFQLPSRESALASPRAAAVEEISARKSSAGTSRHKPATAGGKSQIAQRAKRALVAAAEDQESTSLGTDRLHRAIDGLPDRLHRTARRRSARSC